MYFPPTSGYVTINRNMGCIEICQKAGGKGSCKWINRNMGCIEIGYYAVSIDWMVWINRNMGCIEIIDL